MIAAIIILVLVLVGFAAFFFYDRKQSKDRINKLDSELNAAKKDQIELNKLRIEKIRSENTDEIKKEIENQINEKRELLETLSEELKTKQTAALELINANVNKNLKLTDENTKIQEDIRNNALNLEEIKKEIETLNNLLNELKTRHKTAIVEEFRNDEELGIRFILTDAEKKLIDLLQEIGNTYSDLTKDMRKIEWERV